MSVFIIYVVGWKTQVSKQFMYKVTTGDPWRRAGTCLKCQKADHLSLEAQPLTLKASTGHYSQQQLTAGVAEGSLSSQRWGCTVSTVLPLHPAPGDGTTAGDDAVSGGSGSSALRATPKATRSGLEKAEDKETALEMSCRQQEVNTKILSKNLWARETLALLTSEEWREHLLTFLTHQGCLQP